MDLNARVLEGELMDAPGLDTSQHLQALKGLQRVNFFSGTARVVARAILQHCRQEGRGKQRGRALRILDLACGGGDVTRALGRQLLVAGIDVEIEGWDRSATAIEYARRHSVPLISNRRGDATNPIRFHQRDVQDLQSEHEYDVVMCTLFLHHLKRDEAVQCLSSMYRAARELMLVDDLRRTWLGYRLAQLGCQLLTRSPIVHVDGPLSVRAAFHERELRSLSGDAGLPDPHFQRHWPQRFLMSWKRAS